MSNIRISREEKEKLDRMNEAANMASGCLQNMEPVSLRDQILSEKSRISREAAQKIRKLDNSLKEIENTDAEEVVARAKATLAEVAY
jgi:hypothetical protein